ncbi:MAG: hypothetical protein CMQ61_01775 [Gammaproteobacteria bacterium]|nr:hypothetical protein [Gammaproteobacteria bacterium]
MSTTAQLSSFVAAAALCALAHWAFLAMLTHLRNWWSPPPRLVARAVLNFLATVVLVATLSPGTGSQFGALTAVLLSLLGLVVAAPALDCKPHAKRAFLEWLARHNRVLGLALLVPFAVVAVVLANAPFAGVVSAAFALEIIWFLRSRRRAPARYLQLTHADIRVLEAIADGEIQAFSRRHGIHELLRTKDGRWLWRACDDTTPCPLNYYLTRLGLNTPPCCRSRLRDLTLSVSSALEAAGATYWLDGGTLLGAHRDGGELLAWEDDGDLGVLLDQKLNWDTLVAQVQKCGAEQGYHVEILTDKRYLTVSTDPPRKGWLRLLRNRMRGELRLDLVPYWRTSGVRPSMLARATPKVGLLPTADGFALPERLVLPTAAISFCGQTVASPRHPEAYLKLMYGQIAKPELMYVDPRAAGKRAHLIGDA